ncbi:MAG TPA: prolyl oligopeptidase family serine peptidase [Anaerolineales bacterium]|nr:prolyl oligopeptidase family serine peptidase [Anaerolineales bacterium]
MIKKFSFCLSAILFLAVLAVGQKREEVLVAKVYKGSQGRTMPYRLYVPENYDRQKRYPLVLYLHGGGGRGDDNRKQIEGGNSYIVDLLIAHSTQAKNPSIVVVPQAPDVGWVGYDTITPTSYLSLALELIKDLESSYSIDANRRYVLGQSMGGLGTFAILTMQPKMFAAAVSVCGGGDESRAAQIAHIPIWAFHGEVDQAVRVERSRNMIAALTKAGGKPKYTEYKAEGHVIWTRVVTEPELLPWLFSQKRS